MKLFFTLLVFAGSFLLIAGCGANGEGHEQIAKEVCNCMRPLSKSYEAIKAAQEENNSEALQRFVEEMEAAQEELDACAALIEERYGILEGDREQSVKAAMQKTCPDVIATLNEAENELVQ